MRRQLAVLACATTLATGVAACGDDGPGGSTGRGPIASVPQAGGGGDYTDGRRGGVLTVLSQSDVDGLDPGRAHAPFTAEIAGELGRPLYSYAPPAYDKPVPDTAEGAPLIAADRRTVTVKVRRGIRFSPPVNREVTSRDIAFALSRGLGRAAPNAAARAAFGALAGLDAFRRGTATTIAGLQTPDERTLVLRLERPEGAAVAQALALAVTAPVPEEYATKFDRERPSTYAEHQVATGPYMLRSDRAGQVTGYEPGTQLDLVRNPNWERDTDFRPAYADVIEVRLDVDDADAATRELLEDKGTVAGDLVLPAAALRRIAASAQKDQVAFAGTGAERRPLTRSPDVIGVASPRTATWDLAFTSVGNDPEDAAGG